MRTSKARDNFCDKKFPVGIQHYNIYGPIIKNNPGD